MLSHSTHLSPLQYNLLAIEQKLIVGKSSFTSQALRPSIASLATFSTKNKGAYIFRETVWNIYFQSVKTGIYSLRGVLSIEVCLWFHHSPIQEWLFPYADIWSSSGLPMMGYLRCHFHRCDLNPRCRNHLSSLKQHEIPFLHDQCKTCHSHNQFIFWCICYCWNSAILRLLNKIFGEEFSEDFHQVNAPSVLLLHLGL